MLTRVNSPISDPLAFKGYCKSFYFFPIHSHFFSCLVFISLVNGVIIRCPHLLYGNFSITKIGMVLFGNSIINTFNNINHEECEMACINHDQCKSINIDHSGTTCQLNDKLNGEGGAVLISQDGWSYKSTDYQDPLVSLFHILI